MQSDVMSVQYAQGTRVLTITSNRNFENQAKVVCFIVDQTWGVFWDTQCKPVNLES